MNDAKIQRLAKAIEEHVREIARLAGHISQLYDTLYEELPSADPGKDRKFEDFLLRLTRFRWGLTPAVLGDLMTNAKEMQRFASAPNVPALARLRQICGLGAGPAPAVRAESDQAPKTAAALKA